VKASRIVLLAAAHLCCAGFMSRTALAGGVPAAWSNLWRTPDQQGQALLDGGQPAQAAERFHDPRRRAYADLEADRNPQAAQLLAPFADAQSEYNRGNALAKSGQLQAALAAYDAALKQAPADKDVRHNRDLVERALQQQRQSSQSSRNGQQGGKGQTSSGQQKQQSAGGQRGGSGSQKSASASQQSGSQAGANQAGTSGRRQSGQGSEAQDSNSPQAGAAHGSGSPQETPDQAQRDAALGSAYARDQQRRGGNDDTKGARTTQAAGSELAGGMQTPKQKPETERQLALDQWLRQIPDNPAGLLQRKFLIEHMMRQEDGDGPQEGTQ